MNLNKLNHRQFLLGISVIGLSLIQSQPAISVPTAKDYEQFRGGVNYPDCDFYFDIPKFIAVQKEGGLTGLIGQARFDGGEAKSLVLAVNSGCTYYRTKSEIIHKVARFKSGSYFYNGKSIKNLLSPPSLKDSIFLDDKGMKHTIEHLDTKLSQSPKTPISSTNSSGKIPDGAYLNGDISGGLEVKGNQYRALEPGQTTPWHPISDLRKVSQEIIYASHSDAFGYPYPGYWCSKKAPGWVEWNQRNNQFLYCTNKGWSFKRPSQ